MSSVVRDCVLHGRWAFVEEETALQFDAEHAGCKWPTSSRRFPPKSRKRVAS